MGFKGYAGYLSFCGLFIKACSRSGFLFGLRSGEGGVFGYVSCVRVFMYLVVEVIIRMGVASLCSRHFWWSFVVVVFLFILRPLFCVISFRRRCVGLFYWYFC